VVKVSAMQACMVNLGATQSTERQKDHAAPLLLGAL
jgi:hypothetical protein